MNAGPELDLAVAQAIGICAEIVQTPKTLVLTREGPNTVSLGFSPSTNAADAVWAATKFQLFDNYGWCMALGNSTPYSWFVGHGSHGWGPQSPRPPVTGFSVCGDTVAHAICLAIVELSKLTNSVETE